MSLSIGEMFEIDAPEGGCLLCVVRKLDQRSKRVNYKLHTDARKASEIDTDNLVLGVAQMQARNVRKVTVDPSDASVVRTPSWPLLPKNRWPPPIGELDFKCVGKACASATEGCSTGTTLRGDSP